MSKNQNLLLIGSGGFFGKNIKNIFYKEGYSNFFNFYEISGKSDLDITDQKKFDSYVKKNKITHIINSTAFVGGIGFGLSYPADLLKKNLDLATSIYSVSLENNIDLLINPISNCAYPSKYKEYKEEIFWDGKPHESVFNYGLSKRVFVALGTAYYKQYNLSSANIVLSNMYGPFDHFEEVRSHAIGALISKVYKAKLSNSKDVIVWGDGTPIREWLYVEDGARAMLKSLTLKNNNFFFNVGVNKGISIKDSASIIANIIGWNGNFIFDTTKPNGVDRKTVIDSHSKLLINWEPEVEFEVGVKETIKWYKKYLNE